MGTIVQKEVRVTEDISGVMKLKKLNLKE